MNGRCGIETRATATLMRATLRERASKCTKPHGYVLDDGLYCGYCGLPEKNDIHASSWVVSKERIAIYMEMQ